jgi:serine/threonine protein kinase/tetratricopeptide (TPR) repeat protein
MAMMPGSPPPPGHEEGRSRRWGASPHLPVSVPYPSVACQGSHTGAAPEPGVLGFESLLADFTARWERGETVRVEDYFSDPNRLAPGQLVELIYREYCLAEVAGLRPSPDGFVARFPGQQEALDRLFEVHDVLRSSRLRLWCGPGAAEGIPLPEAGDEIGPYRLLRALGRGGFARVFLAEQADLDDRLVVVKVSTQVTPEPRLLARARHPNIVEVLWHGVVDDGSLQVLCLPFLGGTTLAAVLAERRRLGNRPATGRDLLDDLDRVSAPEFSPSGAGRPARDLLTYLSYSKAAVWVVARLAEALDFAYGRGVLHGDVKPSNVLLTAEAAPMLLDFNLAVGWRPYATGPDGTDLPDDVGGTLAYMAPERLRLVAGPEGALRPTAADRHRADLYALGVVLLELLTGRPPELCAGGQGVTLKALASAYFTSRLQGAGVMIRAARAPVPAGLRSILERCLAVDPADRYRRAAELAEDLDCWRNDRPLVYAPEPMLRTSLFCWASRQRRALIAALCGVAMTAGITAAVVRLSDAAHRGDAILFYQIAGTRDSGAFSLRRKDSQQVQEPGDRAEIARRHLQRFGAFGPGDWREHDEFRSLPRFERDELEVWVLEEALRFAHALGERPDSPDDWRRAVILLQEVVGTRSGGPIEAECRALRDRLPHDALPEPRPAAAGEALPQWMEQYLTGVEAELNHNLVDRSPKDALDHYVIVLRTRPTSFWANYRAACVSFALPDYDAAVSYLGRCVEHCPDNPILRLQYAGCLSAQATESGTKAVGLREKALHLEEAATHYDRAQSLDPDFPEIYLSRAFLRIALGQSDEFLRDVSRYEVLAGLRSPAPELVPRFLDLTRSLSDAPRPDSLRDPRPSLADPDEIKIRLNFARSLEKMGRSDLALAELDKALAIDPDRIDVRYARACVRDRCHDDRAADDYLRVVKHPRVEWLVCWYSESVLSFPSAVSRLIREGRVDEAVSIARKGVALANRYHVNDFRGQVQYSLAVALFHASRRDPSLSDEAVARFHAACDLAPEYVREQTARDPAFPMLRQEFGLLVPHARQGE